MIEFKNVSKSFRRTKVLTDLSFTVPAGKTVALLGLSGSGKTTALKLVCGLHLPNSGEILVSGESLTPGNLSSIRKKIGYVIQDGGLFPHLTCLENLALVGREAGMSGAEIERRAGELAEMTKIAPALLKRYPREISGGQRQRIGIMRALFLDAPILLLDEPMGALDPITRAELQTELKDLFQRLNKTVLLVTHDLFEAGFLSDHILLLNHGMIAQEGTLADLMRKPASDFVRLFVSSQRYEIAEAQA